MLQSQPTGQHDWHVAEWYAAQAQAEARANLHAEFAARYGTHYASVFVGA